MAGFTRMNFVTTCGFFFGALDAGTDRERSSESAFQRELSKEPTLSSGFLAASQRLASNVYRRLGCSCCEELRLQLERILDVVIVIGRPKKVDGAV